MFENLADLGNIYIMHVFDRKLFIFLAILIIVIIAFVVSSPRLKKGSEDNTYVGYWQSTQDGWKPVGTPPACPDPQEFISFTDVRKATSVLYPGQMRSVGYENTSGFRFDGLPNDGVTIVAPIDGEIVQAARFLIEGEMQYVFDILLPCGIMVRFDHLLTLTPRFQLIADSLPEAKENDNRSTFLSTPVKIAKGETIATAVGIKKDNNTFVAWTMFDFNNKNKISQNPSWAALHPAQDHYVICPFQYLPDDDRKFVLSLRPADSMSGSKSDFCD